MGLFSDPVFTFGKYKGTTIDMVAEKDPEYLVWAYENVDHFRDVCDEAVYRECCDNVALGEEFDNLIGREVAKLDDDIVF